MIRALATALEGYRYQPLVFEDRNLLVLYNRRWGFATFAVTWDRETVMVAVNMEGMGPKFGDHAVLRCHKSEYPALVRHVAKRFKRGPRLPRYAATSRVAWTDNPNQETLTLE
jgi:hypothetical protein